MAILADGVSKNGDLQEERNEGIRRVNTPCSIAVSSLRRFKRIYLCFGLKAFFLSLDLCIASVHYGQSITHLNATFEDETSKLTFTVNNHNVEGLISKYIFVFWVKSFLFKPSIVHGQCTLWPNYYTFKMYVLNVKFQNQRFKTYILQLKTIKFKV